MKDKSNKKKQKYLIDNLKYEMNMTVTLCFTLFAFISYCSGQYESLLGSSLLGLLFYTFIDDK